ncbi:MAG: 2,3-bisphosphoglycerate-independent phosphoglycerate mutase [Clostridia bacterium]|nr:2,3-bisphosphoglycerate-independent phosphoglycerate mutase [Clostridia bacterium]
MKKPVVLVVMDGVGETSVELGNMVMKATTPTLDEFKATCPWQTIKAHGGAVGLPTDDDMGNSEVGHNALGCGQIYSQGAKLVNESIESGAIYQSETWKDLVGSVIEKGTALHFIGLLSDGNVHSNISHLIAMIREAKMEGVKTVRIHALLDGRDVPATSAPEYVAQLEAVLAELNDATFDGRIASGGGRMQITMDRYQANWDMVRKGWETHVHGKSFVNVMDGEGAFYGSAAEAVEDLRAATGAIDQDLPPFVIGDNGKPVGAMQDGDSVILFNFRGDRALEISMAFDGDASFDKFDRGVIPQVKYAGMLEYDGDLHIPHKYLVNPPQIRETLTELLVANGIKEYAVSETQKYGHVTYFWNGNRSGKVSEELEDYCEIPSDVRSFDECPWMKATEIADKVIEAIESKQYGFIRCNFPNGDMVGHTGNLYATEIAVESVDLELTRIKKVCDAEGCILIVTADHGNSDQMLEKNKKGKIEVRTAHSLNPVPFIIYDKDERHEMKQGQFGLANVAPTVAELLGIKPFDSWQESMLK